MKKGDIVLIEHQESETLVSGKWKINWRIDDEIGVTSLTDSQSANVYNIKDSTVKITMLQESEASFQSQVEHMTDEQLRASIEGLRTGRIIVTPTKVKKEKAPKVSKDESDLLALMAQLSPEEQLAFKAKYGM